MRIRAKYSLAGAALVAAVVGSTTAMVARAQRDVLRSEAAARLETLTEGVVRLAQESLSSRDELMLVSYLMALQQEHPELRLTRVTREGRTLTLGSDAPGLEYLDRSVRPRSETQAALPPPEGAGLTLRLGFVREALETQLELSLRPLLRRTLAIAALFTLLGALAAAGLGQLMASPLTALSAAAAAVGRGELDVSVPARSQDEVGALAGSFNRMTARLKELHQFREDLLHTLTHELNTPLAGLKGYLELWQQRRLPQEEAGRREVLQTMMAAVLRMEHSLSDALHLFHMEAGGKQAEAQALVWVDDLLQEVVTLFAPVARSKSIRLQPLAKGPAAGVYAEEELLRRVATNLVSNALKYTPEGGEVRVGVREKADAVEFWVSDTGYGMPPEDLPRLFTKFYRSGNGHAPMHKIRGSGLGLSIVKKALDALGGSIRVESALGKGSTFLVLVPKVGPGLKPAREA